MKKNSTLFSPGSQSVSLHVELKPKDGAIAPKQATLERIRLFARAAFSDPSIAGMPAIILN